MASASGASGQLGAAPDGRQADPESRPLGLAGARRLPLRRIVARGVALHGGLLTMARPRAAGERQDRPLDELVGALRRHVELLRDYATKAFQERNEAYLGEVAGKLRVLVGEHGNRALLLSLMKALNVKIEFPLGGPPTQFRPGEPRGDEKVTLRRFLSMYTMGMRLRSGEWIELTNDDIVHLWAEKYGAAHEDWHTDKRFEAFRDMAMFVRDEHHLVNALRSITARVLKVAERFLAHVTPQMIAAAEKRRAIAP